MTANRTLLTILLGFLGPVAAQAQTSLNIYPLNGVIGVKFCTDKKVSLEPRLDFQVDYANGETNLFINPELFTTFKIMREEDFELYTGIGLGANIYNQAQSNFSGSIPLGATYYINDSKRIGIVGECGMKITASDFLKLRSYALVGLQVRLVGQDDIPK